MDRLKIEYLDISELTPYENNTRKHGGKDVEQIANSIERYGFDDPIGVWGKDNTIVEGHGRLMAAKKLGMKEVPVIRLDNLTDEQRKEYTIAHNRTAELSEWDFDKLKLELESIDDSVLSGLSIEEMEEDASQSAWRHLKKYVDLAGRSVAVNELGYCSYFSYKSKKKPVGIELDEVKQGDTYVQLLAEKFEEWILRALGENIRNSTDWAIVTTPRRRHLEGFHFATEVCKTAAEKVGLRFYDGLITAKDRNRVEPRFEMTEEVKEKNVILYDDILTTGMTMKATRDILQKDGHIVLSYISIMNR